MKYLSASLWNSCFHFHPNILLLHLVFLQHYILVFFPIKKLPSRQQVFIIILVYLKGSISDAREEGREEGMEYLNQLNKYLLKSKRYNDLERATEDIEYQKKLLKEFGIE